MFVSMCREVSTRMYSSELTSMAMRRRVNWVWRCNEDRPPAAAAAAASAGQALLTDRPLSWSVALAGSHVYCPAIWPSPPRFWSMTRFASSSSSSSLSRRHVIDNSHVTSAPQLTCPTADTDWSVGRPGRFRYTRVCAQQHDVTYTTQRQRAVRS